MTGNTGKGRRARGIVIPALAALVILSAGLIGAAPVSATPATAPPAPTMFGVITVDADPTLHVAFVPDPDDGGSAIVQYDASCSSDDGGDPASASGYGTPVTGFLISGFRELVVSDATAGKTYTCTVTATNGVGTSAASDASQPVVAGKPEHGFFTATVGATSIEFEAVPGPDDLGYTATCTSGDGGAARTGGSSTVDLVVTGLTAGKTYNCAERAFVTGGVSAPSATGDFIAGRPTPTIGFGFSGFFSSGGSSSPGDLGPGNGSIGVEVPPDFQSYLPITSYRATCTSSDGGPTGVGTAPADAPGVFVGGLQNGKTYTCTVAAANANGYGIEGPPAEPVMPGRPVAPLVFDVTPGSQQLSIRFIPGDSPGNPTIRWNAACSSSDGGASGSGFVTNPNTPIVVSGLTNGKTYTCTVDATNARGTGLSCDGDPSVFGCDGGPLSVPTLVGRPTPPFATDVVATGPGTVQVDAESPDHAGGSAIVDYTAQCTSPDGGVSGTASSDGFPFSVTGLTDGKVYECRARANNSDGAGSWAEFGVPVIPGRPSPPIVADPFTAAVAGNGQLTVSFAPPSHNGGSSITGYDVACEVYGEFLPTDLHSASGSQSPITVTGLTNGVTYGCIVTASNAGGAGSPALVLGVVGPGAAPTITSVVPGNGQIIVNFEPANDFFSAFGSFKITCSSTDGGATHTKTVDFPMSGTVKSLTNGKSYTCRVNAVLGSVSGAPSAKSAVVKPGLPTAPRNLNAIPGNGTIKLTFSQPTTSGGFTRTGYRATCGSTNGGVGRVQTGTVSPITVAGVTNAKSYNCTVAAVNSKGAGIGASKTAIVPGLPTAPRSVSALSTNEGVATVKFTAPTANGGASITSYRATCTSSNGGATRTKTAAASPLTVTGLTDGKSYSCKVTASTSKGTGASSALTATFTSGAPSAPRDVVADVGVSGEITFTFTPPAGTGGATIASYQVSCTSSDGGDPGTKTLGASPITVDHLTNLKSYSCTVKPQSTGGDGLTTTVSGIFVHDAS